MNLDPVTPLRRAMRVALSHYVAIGCVAALGLLLISVGAHLWLGSAAAAAAGVGAMAATPPDAPAPRRGKLRQMLPAPILGMVLFFAVQRLHDRPVLLGLLLIPATFIAFLGMAWGKRGAPIAIAATMAMIFSMAVPIPSGGETWRAAATSAAYFGLGAFAYVFYSVLANLLLNARYRVLLVADVLLALTALLRLQARQFTQAPQSAKEANTLTGTLLVRHAALADQLQAARDIVLESPRTPRRQRLAGMLMIALEMRDHIVACELDLDTLRQQPEHAGLLARQQSVLLALADELDELVDSLLFLRRPATFANLLPQLEMPAASGDRTGAMGDGFTPERLARGLTNRIINMHDEVHRLVALARNEAAPDLAVVRANWQMFVSPTGWSWQPFLGMWTWRNAPLRHALRATLAVATGYLVAYAMPWGTHDYWVLLTIVVVLRGNLAQTLERRNARVLGTMVGCVLATALLAAHLSLPWLLLCLTLAQALAHGFALRRYVITAMAATVLGLVQAHLLNVGMSPSFALAERLSDTLIGAAIAWAFAYVLPSWEKHQIPALVARTLLAQARHAREALGLAQLQAVDNAPELAWRLARREAYDSLTALVQATERAWKEPRAVRPPLLPLQRMQANCYRLLAQLTAVKTMLLLRRGRLQSEQLQAPMQAAVARIEATLTGTQSPADTTGIAPDALPAEPPPPLDERDLAPWVLRRMQLAEQLARELRVEADHVLRK